MLNLNRYFESFFHLGNLPRPKVVPGARSRVCIQTRAFIRGKNDVGFVRKDFVLALLHQIVLFYLNLLHLFCKEILETHV